MDCRCCGLVLPETRPLDPASGTTRGRPGQKSCLTLPVKYASQARRTVRMTAWLTSRGYCPSHFLWYLVDDTDATDQEGPIRSILHRGEPSIQQGYHHDRDQPCLTYHGWIPHCRRVRRGLRCRRSRRDHPGLCRMHRRVRDSRRGLCNRCRQLLQLERKQDVQKTHPGRLHHRLGHLKRDPPSPPSWPVRTSLIGTHLAHVVVLRPRHQLRRRNTPDSTVRPIIHVGFLPHPWGGSQSSFGVQIRLILHEWS